MKAAGYDFGFCLLCYCFVVDCLVLIAAAAVLNVGNDDNNEPQNEIVTFCLENVTIT